MMSRTTLHSEPGVNDRALLTVEEAADRLGIGRTTMYGLVSSGVVESVTLGRLRRIPSECVDDFVSTLRKKQAGVA